MTRPLLLPLLLLLLLLLLLPAAPSPRRFDGYRVYRVFPASEAQLQALSQLTDLPDGLSFWLEPRGVGRPVDVLVPPRLRSAFLQLARGLGAKPNLSVPDVQRLLDQQPPVGQLRELDWTFYPRLAEMDAWLDWLGQRYPGQLTSLHAGNSTEGRPIRGVRLSYGPGNPAVFVEGGIHAREWISPATVTYILNQLLTSQDPAVRDIAENYDWYIFPSVNPDGYEYTHTTDRTWRKTRSKTSDSCYGVDPNRNWDFAWNTVGAGSDPCSNTYAGPAAFSEPETRGLAAFLRQLAAGGRLRAYIDFHSSGQLLMFPFGHETAHVPEYDRLLNLTQRAAAALQQRYGTRYTCGSIAETIYLASGSSLDWAYANLHVNVSVVYELRDTGRYGFLLPPEQIIPTAEETLDSVVSILQDALR